MENLYLLSEGETFLVVGQATGKQLTSQTSASEALRFALETLADSGGEVMLQPGKYVIDSVIEMPSYVTLRGSGKATQIMVAGEIGVRVQGRHHVVIADLSLCSADTGNAKTGVVVSDSSQCQVRNLYCSSFTDYGVQLSESSSLCTIEGCSLSGNGLAGIYCLNLERGTRGDFLPNTIRHCTVYGGGRGLECNHAIVVNILGCTFYQNTGSALYIHSTSNSLLVNGCRAFQTTGDAVVVDSSDEFNLTGNIFCWQTEHGVVIRNADWGVISGNELIDNGSFNPGGPDQQTSMDEMDLDVPAKCGVVLEKTHGYTVQSNTIFNWALMPKMEFGIREDATSFKNVISGNNINYTEGDGVSSQGEESVVENNVCYAPVSHSRVNDLAKRKQIEAEHRLTKLQSFQPEITEALIQRYRSH